MQVHDPLTPEQRRTKNRLMTLDRLTDLRKRADELRELLSSMDADRLRTANDLQCYGRIAIQTLYRDVQADSMYMTNSTRLKLPFSTVAKVIAAIDADLKAELTAITDEMDAILNDHCERIAA